MTRGLWVRFVLLTGTAIGLVGLSALIQELQAASTAWIAGQGHWSRGQQDATAALSRYLARGDAHDLNDARRALQVPLGDLHARLALEQPEPDLAKAREGFRRREGRRRARHCRTNGGQRGAIGVAGADQVGNVGGVLALQHEVNEAMRKVGAAGRLVNDEVVHRQHRPFPTRRPSDLAAGYWPIYYNYAARIWS